jgi:hypothetical protein
MVYFGFLTDEPLDIRGYDPSSLGVSPITLPLLLSDLLALLTHLSIPQQWCFGLGAHFSPHPPLISPPPHYLPSPSRLRVSFLFRYPSYEESR